MTLIQLGLEKQWIAFPTNKQPDSAKTRTKESCKTFAKKPDLDYPQSPVTQFWLLLQKLGRFPFLSVRVHQFARVFGSRSGPAKWFYDTNERSNWTFSFQTTASTYIHFQAEIAALFNKNH